jgi:ribonuclease P protein component
LGKQYTLAKEERIKSRSQTEELFSSGKKFSQGFLRMYFLITKNPANPGLKFGAGVSTKIFKKAVDRNRTKRLIREAYRLQKKELNNKLLSSKTQLAVFFIYTGKELPVYNEVFETMQKTLKKLETYLPKEI